MRFYIGREKYLEFINNVIDNSENLKQEKDNENASFVLCIDGKWGCGKTTFINELIDQKNRVYIKYDAWKADFWDI